MTIRVPIGGLVIFAATHTKNVGTGKTSKQQMNADRTLLTEAMWMRTVLMLLGKATDPGVTAANKRKFL